MRRSILLGLVLLLATVGVLSPTEQASAEGGPVLVSNLAQTSSGSLANLSLDWAQGFTTGGRSGGYTLTSVDWAITNLADTAVFTNGLRATINSDSGSGPGTVVGTLTNPAFEATTSERTYTFTAPSGGIHLAANTTYYFVVDVQRGIGTSNNQFAHATGSAEDASSQSGWSIENSRYWRVRTQTGGFTNATLPMKIRVNGAEPRTNSAGTYTVPHDWALKPTGLNAGDEFRLVFMTNTWRDATATDIAAYDAHIQASAAGSHDGGAHEAIKPYSSLFKVVGSTSAVDARDHIGANPTNTRHRDAPIYWMGGSRIAASNNSFWSTTWENWGTADRRSPAGVAVNSGTSNDWHWTGTQDDGAKASGNELGATNVRRGRFRVDGTTTGPLSGGGDAPQAQTHALLGISPIFRVGNPPGYSVTMSWNDGTSTPPTAIDEGRSNLDGGGNISLRFTLNQPAPTGGIDLGPTLLGFGNLVNVSVQNVGDTKIAAGQTTKQYRVSVPEDAIDGPDLTMSVTYRNDPGFTLTPASGTLTLPIRDNDPTSVDLVVDQDIPMLVDEGTVIRFRVELSRSLAAGETIVVPLGITGASDQINDYRLTLNPGAANLGVTLHPAVRDQPQVVFSGAGARTAVLDFELRKDNVRETGQERITVALDTDTLFDFASGTNVGGGADPKLRNGATSRFTVTVVDELPFVQFRTRVGGSWVTANNSASDPLPTITLQEGGARVEFQWRLMDPLNRPFARKSLQVGFAPNNYGGYIGGGGNGEYDNDRLDCNSPGLFNNAGQRAYTYSTESLSSENVGDGDRDGRNGCPFGVVFITRDTVNDWQSVSVSAGEDADAYDHFTHLVFDPGVVVSSISTGSWFDYQTALLPVKIVDDDQWEQDLAISTDGGTTWTNVADGGMRRAFPASLSPGDHTFMLRLANDPAGISTGITNLNPSATKYFNLWIKSNVTINTTADVEDTVRFTSTADAYGLKYEEPVRRNLLALNINYANPVTFTVNVPDGYAGNVSFIVDSSDLYQRTDTEFPDKEYYITGHRTEGGQSKVVIGGEQDNTRTAPYRTRTFGYYKTLTSCVGCQRIGDGDPSPPPAASNVGDLTATNLSDSGITISWPWVEGAEGYQVRYWSTTSPFPGVPAEEAYYGVTTVETTQDIEHLEPETEYRATVFYMHGGQVHLSSASPTLRFTTLASGAPTQATPTSPVLERIPEATISANASTIDEGDDAVFTVTLNPAPSTPTEVNVDVQHQGGLVVEADQVGRRTVTVPTSGSAEFTVPTYDDANPAENVPLYAGLAGGDGYRVSPSGGGASVYINNDDVAAEPVTTIAIKQLTGTTATIVWAPREGDTRYQVGWFDVLDPLLNWDTITATEYQLTGLEPETAYSVSVIGYRGAVETGTYAIGVVTLAAGQSQDFTVSVSQPPQPPEVSVTGGDDVTEGGDAVFTITADPAPAADLRVAVTVSADGDYGAATGRQAVTIAGGSSSATLTVSTTDDEVDEDDGSVTVTVERDYGYEVSSSAGAAAVAVADDDGADSGYTVDPDVVAKVTALASQTQHGPAHVNRWNRVLVAFGELDGTGVTGGPMTAAEAQIMDDTQGSPVWTQVVTELTKLEAWIASQLPELSISGGSAITEGGAATFTITANPAPTSPITVNVGVSESGAFGASGAATVTVSGAATTYTVTTTDDSVDEADGTVTTTLQAGTGYTVSSTQGSASVDVADNDIPELSITGGSGITEGGTATFTITAGPVPATPITVRVGVSAEGDFGANGASTVTVSGATTTYTVTTSDDSTDEADGSITATLQSGTGYTVSSTQGSASVDVSDDDESTGYVFDSALIAKVKALAAQTQHGTAHVNRWNRVLVAFGEHDGTAVTGDPMTAAQAQIMDLTQGSPVWTEVHDELTKYEAWLATQESQDDDLDRDQLIDQTPVISISGGSGITEGGTATFTITASPAPTSPITVKVGVSQRGSFGANGAATIQVSGASATYTISTTDDSVDEPDGAVTATLKAGSGYTVSSTDGAAAVSVSDDDDPPVITPVVSIAGGSGITEGGTATFTITASPAPTSPITVKVGVSQRGSFGANGAATIQVSGASTTYTITTSDDSVDEADGSVTATLKAGSGYTVSTSNGDATVSVSDDDIPELSITGGSGITEGGTATFTITASPAPTSPITVNLGVSESGDFGANGAATITVSGATATYTVTTADDNVDEADGSVTATLKAGSGYTVSSSAGSASVDVSDDDAPEVEISVTVDEDVSASEGGYLEFTVRLSEASTEKITVQWNTGTAWGEDDRAHGGDDYEEVFDELVFAPGVTEMTAKVWLEADGEAEEDEHFVVEIFLPGSWWPPDATGIMTIIDAD